MFDKFTFTKLNLTFLINLKNCNGRNNKVKRMQETIERT